MSRDAIWPAALMVAVTAIGLALRLIGVTEIPTGLHGDEALVGMEGQRILREGLIAPYSWTAHGQPSGPLYLAALTVWLLDNTVLAVRLSAVIFGTLAVPALYLVVRRHLDASTAVASAGLLAVLGWHIHYSRIAFPIPAWPLWVILTVGVVAFAARRRTPLAWAAAGAMTGLGTYMYNAHPLVIAIISLFVGLSLLSDRWRIGWAEIRGGLAYAGALLAAMIPMFWFVASNLERYRTSVSRHSVRQSDEWQALEGPLDQAGFVVERYLRFWQELSIDPQVDYVDAAGITETVPVLLLALALLGLVIALLRRRNPFVTLAAMIVLLMPITTVLTLHAEQRRTLVIAPFLAMFAAIGVVAVVRWARGYRKPALFWGALTVCLILVGTGVAIDLRNYYVEFAKAQTQHWVFAEPFADASHYMRNLDDDRYVYFLADRWSIDYEPRRFLAPDTRGEDRSEEFGQHSLEVTRDQGRPVFILVGDYLPLLDELREMYPGGEVTRGGDDGSPTFIAYELPAP